MDSGQLERLHQEIRGTQLRRHKLDLLKIGFVTALLGFGAVEVGEFMAFYQTLYLVPLVAVFFDLLIMGEHFSVRRLGAFLRLHSPDKLEQKWEIFVSKTVTDFSRMVLAALPYFLMSVPSLSCIKQKEILVGPNGCGL